MLELKDDIVKYCKKKKNDIDADISQVVIFSFGVK